MKELSKTKAAVYASLGSVKMRRKHGLFIIEGEKSVHDTILDFEVEAIILLQGVSNPLPISEEKIFYARPEVMKKISNLTTPSNIIAVYKIPDPSAENAERINSDALYIMLDGVQDPGNLGTIIRTCHWFGIKRIFASRDTVDLYNPKTIQSTMGSLAKVIVEYCDLKEIITNNPDMPVYGMMLEGQNIYEADLKSSGFVIMGNEGNGISPRIRELLTQPLLIPPTGDDHGESLNVAIATAITLSQFESLKYKN